MPIYDYRCSACGHLTEIVHGINDHGPTFCPECGAEGTMSKGFTTPAIHFKGSGWAKKDRSSTSASKSSTDSSDATDAKPAATTEGPGKDKASTGTASATKPEAKPAPSAGSAD
ncbi:MAG TPA: zinc ribbon domain-containing protein [Candidatus Limnocylindrales bacterium]